MALRALVVVLAMVFGFGGAAQAQYGVPAPGGNPPTQVTTDVNLRAGPGTQYQALLVIPGSSGVQLFGCSGDWSWCNVQYAGVSGWVATRYLFPPPAGMAMPVPPPPSPPGLPTPQISIQLPFPFGNGDDDFGKQVTITGTLTNEGVECQAMRGDNGKMYTLVGMLGGYGPGSHVKVKGSVVEFSPCMQGKTIQVRTIKFAN